MAFGDRRETKHWILRLLPLSISALTYAQRSHPKKTVPKVPFACLHRAKMLPVKNVGRGAEIEAARELFTLAVETF